jgi:hypothetical protein
MPITKSEKTEILKHAIQDCHAQLGAAASFGIAADQRASTLASVYVTAATVIAAAAFGFINNSDLTSDIVVSTIIACGGLYIAGMICIITAMPTTFYSAGNPPEYWEWQLKTGNSLSQALKMQLDEHKDKIAINKKTMLRNAKFFKFGALTGVIAPIISFLYLIVGLLIQRSPFL